jgi:hypothetical protein
MNEASGSDDNTLAALLDAFNMTGSSAFYRSPQTTNVISSLRQRFRTRPQHGQREM